jgi:hypothetical protein
MVMIMKDRDGDDNGEWRDDVNDETIVIMGR